MITSIDQNTLDRIDSFRQRFARLGYGEGHFIFACHAAFPIALTADLLYQLWVNFKTYPDADQTERGIDALAVSDVLLSGLCRDTGQGIFEMDLPTRAHLLAQLEADPRFGPTRQNELAVFLYQYTDRIAPQKHAPAFVEAQRWAALATLAPQRAAEELQAVLSEKIRSGQEGDILRLRNLLESYANQEAGLERLLHYSKGLKAAIFEMDPTIIQNEMQLAEVQLLPVEATGEEANEAGVFHLPLPSELREQIDLPDAEPPTPTTEADRRIAEARRTRATSLDLSRLELEAIPPEVFELDQLRSLDLFINKITRIPPQIAQLRQLEELLISSNPIQQLPMELAKLSQLRVFKLENGQLDRFPEVLLQLPNIKRVSLDNNDIPYAPEAIAKLEKLQLLDLRKNTVANLPLALHRTDGDSLRAYFNISQNRTPKPDIWLMVGPRSTLDFQLLEEARSPVAEEVHLEYISSTTKLFQICRRHPGAIKRIHLTGYRVALPREDESEDFLSLSPELLAQLIGPLPACQLLFLHAARSAPHAELLFEKGIDYTIGLEGEGDAENRQGDVQRFYENLSREPDITGAFNRMQEQFNPSGPRTSKRPKRKAPPQQQQAQTGSSFDPEELRGLYQWRLFSPEPIGLDIKRLYALLVGIDQYEPGSPVIDYPTPATTIFRFRDYLAKTCRREAIDFEVRLLQDQEANYGEVINAFRSFLGQAGPEDGVLFYFSGQGARIKVPVELQRHVGDREMSALVLSDTTSGHRHLASIELQALVHELNERCENVNIILDCSHAAGFGFKLNKIF
ncbi:MAG: leucine-rich repeat domain-containing protein [Bacteroidota bacterium]